MDLKDTHTADTPKADALKTDTPKACLMRALNPATALFALVALVIGLLLGMFVLNRGAHGDLAPIATTTLQENQLDTIVASYTYNGSTNTVTAREVMEQLGTLDQQKQDDGNYSVPRSDTVLSYIRSAVLLKSAEDKGISVSDDDLNAYTKDNYQVDDVATLATQLGMDEDITRKLLKNEYIFKKLRESVVTTQVPDIPTSPTAPADNDNDAKTTEYADYVIALLGDEWDGDNNTWAREDGPYYQALSSMEVSQEGVSYTTAQAAYSVASQQYQQLVQQSATEWADYLNGLLANVTVSLNSATITQTAQY